MNKWRLLLFSVFGLLQITTSDRNFIDGRCCERSFRYSESDTRISFYEPYHVNRISPDLETRKSLETRPRTRAKESSRRDINNREYLRRTNVDHQTFERHRMREPTNDPQITQRRDFSREKDFEYSGIKRDNTQRERPVKNGDRVFRKDSRSEVASRDNNRQNDERERFGNSAIRQDDGFEYRRRFARNFADDRMSANRKSENNPQKRERRVSDTSRIAKSFENRNTMKQHLFNDEARKIKEVRYQSEMYLKNDEVRNTRNELFVREYRNKEESFIQNRIRSNTRSRNNKNDFVLNRLQERRINKRVLTVRNIRLNKRSVSDEHLNYVRGSILGDENIIRNNRQKVRERTMIMSRGSISEEPQRHRDENRRERTQKNINENRIREDSRNTNRDDLRRNRNLKFETRRDNYERALEEDSATIRVTRRSASMRDLRDDVRDINRENRFSQRTSQIRRQDTRLETSNMIERHIRNSRELRQIQEREICNLKESRNIRTIERKDNGQFKVQADASLERRAINIHSKERSRVHTDDRRERNFIRDDIRQQQRQQDRESSRMRSNSVSRRINVDGATDNIDDQLRQTRLQNTQERRDTRRQNRSVSRARNISASRRYNDQNMVIGELQRLRSRRLEERSSIRLARDISVRSNKANSNDFRNNNLDERQVNLYSRENRNESRKLSVRVLSHMENREEHRSRSQPPEERLSIRQNYRNILRSHSADLPNRYTTSNNRDNVRNGVRSGDIEKSLNYKRSSTDIARARSTILRTFRNNKNNEESRRTATQNMLRHTRRIGSEEFKIDSTRLLQTYISQNRRNDEASRRIRSRSFSMARRTENRHVRMNRDGSFNERSARIEHADERRDTRRVHLIAAKRSTLFADNMRDITMTQKTKTASNIFEMTWQYIFYALQGIYICSLLLKLPQNHGKKQLRITNWLTPVNYMKID